MLGTASTSNGQGQHLDQAGACNGKVMHDLKRRATNARDLCDLGPVTARWA
jgi:hypothetical protein